MQQPLLRRRPRRFAEATRYTNQIGNITTWAYDAAQRLTNEIGLNVYTNRFVYAPAGDLRELYDGKDQRTAWGYDAEGRLLYKTNQSSVLVQTNGYNAKRELTARWTPAKGLTTYTYDRAGNLTFVNYPVSPDITYQYNALSRLTNMIDAAGTSRFTYNLAGDLLTETMAGWASSTLTYGYHANVPRLLTSVSQQQPSGTWWETFGYDAARRLQTVATAVGTHTYTYSPGVGATPTASLLVRKIALFGASGSYITNTFDTSGRLTETLLRNSSHVNLNRHAYTYNNANQRTAQTRFDGSTVNYGYDTIGQLISATGSENLGYKYDAAFNLNVRTNTGVTTAFGVNVRNELTTSPTAPPLTTPTATSPPMASAPSPTTTKTSSSPLSKAPPAASSPTTASSACGCAKNIGPAPSSTKPATSISAASSCRSAMATTARPSTTPAAGTSAPASRALAASGGLLARSAGASTAAYHTDGSGNITALLETTGNHSTYRYDPFGNLLASSGSLATANVYRFSSKEFHGASGLYYYGFRFYDPLLQRWVNQDPIGESGGQNLYQFSWNNPTTFGDTFGECPLIIALPALIEAGAGAAGSIIVAALPELALSLGIAAQGYTISEITERFGRRPGRGLAEEGLSSVNAPPALTVSMSIDEVDGGEDDDDIIAGWKPKTRAGGHLHLRPPGAAQNRSHGRNDDDVQLSRQRAAIE